MKRIVSLLLIAVVLSTSFLTMSAMAEDIEYFSVNFVPGVNKFVVSSTDALKGTNRVLLIVQDAGNTIYMDSFNATASNSVYFEVKLGDTVVKKEYVFIISSIGDTLANQTIKCMADIPEVSSWFTVEYDSIENAFRVNSVEGIYRGTNRVLLTAYLPEFNGVHEIWYMDAINAARSFSFKVPIPELAPIGLYRFRVSTIGDVKRVGNVICEYSQDFTGYTEYISGSTDIKMGGKYVLNGGADAEGIALYVALYKKVENDDEVPLLVRATYSGDVITEDGISCIKADLTLTEEEQTSDYYVRVYAWKQATVYPLAPSIRINQ